MKEENDMAEVKHGGCFDCGTKEQEILKSTPNPKTPLMGKAVCDKCLAKQGA